MQPLRTTALRLLFPLCLAAFAPACGDDAGSGTDVPLDPDPNHCKDSDFTCVRSPRGPAIAQMGTPFDPNAADTQSGPDDWAGQYGTAPQYFAWPNADGSLELAWNDAFRSDDSDKGRTFHMTLRKGEGGWQTVTARMLYSAGKVLGFSKDEANKRFYFVTAISEDLSVAMSPTKLHRPNILKMIEYSGDMKITKTWDIGKLRGVQHPDSLPIYSPINFSSARVLFGGGKVAMLFGVNTEVDPAIMRRHQMARYMELDVKTDRIDREAGIWCSHSFDQRLSFDGEGFVETHLGDAYPRAVELARHVIGKEAGKATIAVSIKGKEGDNNTFSRLGGSVAIDDTTYLVLFVTESSDGTTPVDGMKYVAGARNLGLARVDVGTAKADSSFGSDYTVTVSDGGGKTRSETSSVVWLNSGNDTLRQVERPRIARLGPNKNVILCEYWTKDQGGPYRFSSIRALLVDDNGKVLTRNNSIAHPNIRMARSDDLFVVGGKATWFSGDANGKTIWIHQLDANLALESNAVK